MSIDPPAADPQAVRSRARGRRFVIPLLAAWPLGILIALVAVVLGAGVPVAIASGLAVALLLDFVWVAVTFAVDDGQVEERARAASGAGAADGARGEESRAAR
jgi:hypothetical protein